MRQALKTGGVNVDKTLSFTQSSFAYKDPFHPQASPLWKMYNRTYTYFSLRNIENEFTDFTKWGIDEQISEIYKDCAQAYRRKDKVTMKRSLSEGMFNYLVQEAKSKSPTPFLKDIQR
jgi:hypothetical protein